MKIVLINGSPRKDGNSTILGGAVVEGATSCGTVELPEMHVASMDFRGCQNCGSWNETGICAVKDDMQPAYAALREADIWVFTSLIYFDTMFGNFTQSRLI